MIVSDERPLDVLTGLVVVPDRGGQREDAGQNPGDDAAGSATAVSFQVQLSLEGPVDRLDHLPQRLEQVLPGPAGLALADWAQQYQLTLGEIALEGPAEVVLVPDQLGVER